jgi:hypothetical protein
MSRAVSQSSVPRQEQRQPVAGSRQSETVEPFWGSIVIRVATAGDRPSLERLAQVGSAGAPAGAILIGLLGGRAVAALSLTDGTEIAEPFVAKSDVLELLRLRARQLRRPPHNQTPRPSLRHVDT